VAGGDTRRLLTVIPVAQLIVSTGHGRITPCPHPVRGEGMHGTETSRAHPTPSRSRPATSDQPPGDQHKRR
jgi:hypothetical protein